MTTTNKKRAAKKTSAANDAEIRVRIDARTKNKAERIFKRLGMSSSDAVRIFLSQTIEEKGLPFQPHILNPESRKAIEESLSGEGEITTIEDVRKMWDEA